MHIMYVDESGDPGINNTGKDYFILSGLIISETDWLEGLNNFKTLRKFFKQQYGLNQREEVHAAELVRVKSIAAYKRIKKTDRIKILKTITQELPNIFPNAKVINICLQKSEHDMPYEIAWNRIIQRYDTYLKRSVKDRGIIIMDEPPSRSILRMVRKMRVYNIVSSKFGSKPRSHPTDNIIEDIYTKNSKDSYYIQAVDVITYSLYLFTFPKGALKKYGAQYFFKNLEPILLKEASSYDNLGIVRK